MIHGRSWSESPAPQQGAFGLGMVLGLEMI